MHNIKSVLSGAEKLFFDMGYARDDSNPEILKLKTGRLVVPLPSLVFSKSYLGYIKDVMQGKLFQKCTHLLYCSVLSLGANVNTRRMSEPDMESIFHIKKSMKYSGHRKLLFELSKLSKFNAFNLLGY